MPGSSTLSRPTKPSLKIQIDGACRGNPGPAGVGVLLLNAQGRRLKEIATYLGEATNNVAEFCALIIGLQEALRTGARQVAVFTDSELLARQVSGEYRVRDRQLRWLHVLIQNLLSCFEQVQIQHVPRAKNRQADRLASQAVTEGIRHSTASRRKGKAMTVQPPVGQLTLFQD